MGEKRIRSYLARVPVALAVVASSVALSPALSPAPAGAAPSKPAITVQVRAAEQALTALQTAYGTKKNLYADSPGTYASLWEYSQALAAAQGVTSLPGGNGAAGNVRAQDLAGLSRYWNPRQFSPAYTSKTVHPSSGASYKYFDDNVWVGLDLMKQWHRTHDAATLARVEQIFTFEHKGWLDHPGIRVKGGVPWTLDPTLPSVNTVSTAGAGLLAAQLAEATGKKEYAAFAVHANRWVNAHMKNGQNLFIDHKGNDGTPGNAIWSYNQGLVILLNLALNQVTGQHSYLAAAVRIGTASVAHFSQPGMLASQPPFFNVVYLDALATLSRKVPVPQLSTLVDIAISSLAPHVNPSTDVLKIPGSSTPVLDQASYVQLLTLRAQITLPKTAPSPAPSRPQSAPPAVQGRAAKIVG